MKEKSIFKNTVIYTIKLLTAFAFPVISEPYVNRVLGVNSIGIYNYSATIIAYFLLFSGLGVSTYAIREGAKIRNDKEKFQQFASDVISINIVSMTCTLILLFIIVYSRKSLEEYKAVLLLLSLELPLTFLGTNWVFNIYEDYAYITIRSFLFQIIALITLLFIVHSPQDILQYAAVNIIATYGSNILNFFYARRYFRLRIRYRSQMKKHLKPIFILFGSAVASEIYINADITMLGMLTNDHTVGIYSAASRIYNLARMGTSAFITVVQPRLSLYSLEKKKYEELFSRAFNYYLAFIIPISFILAFSSREIIAVFGGNKFDESIRPLMVLSFAFLFSVIGSAIANFILVIFQMENVILYATVIGAISNIVGNYFLIPIWGATAAAFTTLFSEMLVLSVQVYFAQKKLKIFSLRQVKEVSKSFISAFLLAFYCMVISLMKLSVFFSILVKGIGVIAIFIITLRILHPEMWNFFYERIELKIYRRKK